MFRTTEITEITGVPETTLRRFIKRFRHYIVVERRGRWRYYHESAIEVIKTIRRRRDAGATYEEIESELESKAVYTIEPIQEPESLPAAINEKIADLLKAFVNQKKEIESLKDEVRTLKEQMQAKEETAKEEKMQLCREINQLLIESQKNNNN